MHPSNIFRILTLKPSRVQRSLIDRALEWAEGPSYKKRAPNEAREALSKLATIGADFRRWPMPSPKGIAVKLDPSLISRLSDDQVDRIVANDICPNVKAPTLKKLSQEDGFRSYLLSKVDATILCPPGLFGEIVHSDLGNEALEDRFISDFLDSLIESDFTFTVAPPRVRKQPDEDDADLMDMDFNFDFDIEPPTASELADLGKHKGRREVSREQPKSAIAYMDPFKDRYLLRSTFSHPSARLYPSGDWFIEFCDFIDTLDFATCPKGSLPRVNRGSDVSIDIRGRDRKGVACTFRSSGGWQEISVEITPDVLFDYAHPNSPDHQADIARAAAAVEDNRHVIAYHIAVKLGAAAEVSRQQVEAILADQKVSAQVEVARHYLQMVSGYESGILTRTAAVDGVFHTVTILPGRRVGLALTPYSSGHYHVGWDNKVSHRDGPLLNANETLANRIIEQLVAEEPSVFELAEWRGFLASTREALDEFDGWRVRAARFLQAANKLKTWLSGSA